MSRTTRILAASLLAAAPSLVVAQRQTAGARPSPAARGALVDSVVRRNIIASTRYRLGSVSKQFTAASILRQVERGRLSLGDSIARHFAGVPAEWRPITIEQLPNHTSGLAPELRDPNRRTETYPTDTLVAMGKREPMAGAPGAGYVHSNTGDMLLGVLVEEPYGRPYAVVLRDEIARPLGLTTPRFCGDRDVAPEATGYQRAPDGTSTPSMPIHPSQMLGMGGICSTVRDVETWNRALHGGRVLSAAAYAPQPMVHESGATYAVGKAGSGTTTTFLVDAAGQVVGMLTRANGTERTLRRVR